ncbi:MAG: efflux transporter outer membrane subunit [Syntrophobacteraceae bacterium]
MRIRRYRPRFFAVLRDMVVIISLIVLAGCSVGPKYQRPEATTIPGAYFGVNAEWKIAAPQADLPRGNWWEMFGDAELNGLETDAMAANQDLKAAVARFEQARAVANVAKSGLSPHLNASFQPTEQRDSLNRPAGGHPGKIYDTFTVPFDLSYEIDLWGRVRNLVQSSKAQVQAGADDVESVKLAIQTEVASNYFSLRTLDSEKALLLSNIESFRKSLELTRNRRAHGMVSDLDVSQAETVFKTAQAQLSDTMLQRAKMQNVLAVLSGKNASLFRVEEKVLGIATFVVPPGLPSELLERRPDIAAAERRMAAANAGIGVATAAFYPSIKFGGLAGFQSGDIGTLFNWPSRLWALGPSVTAPIFDGGQRRGNFRQTEAAYDETVARYRQIVLNAFSEVENNIAAEHLLGEEYEQQLSALQSARRQLEIANNRYKSGLVTYIEVATAQNTALSSERAAVRLRGQQLLATIALIKALGGGWKENEINGRNPLESKEEPLQKQ